MTSKHARGSALALFSILWLALTAWVVVGDRVSADPPDPIAAEEPPAPPSVWQRLRSGVNGALGKSAEADRAAVRGAVGSLGVPEWHKAGLTGKGVKVAILDSGFRGYRSAQGVVVPASLAVKSFRKDGLLDARESQHGILCGEVVHHIAPSSEMLFANWEAEQPAVFLDAVRWARAQGARVISCSVIMPSWSDGEGGGAIHEELRRILGAGDKATDCLFFASAGNTALRTWTGPCAPNPDGWHQWTRGHPDNAIRPLSRDRISVEVTSRDAGYEMVILDTTKKLEVARAKSLRVEGITVAVVRFEPAAGHRYAVKLRPLDETKGKKPGVFHLTVLGGKLGTATKAGSIPFPADGAEVVAVGAVDDRGHRHAYSSCGPVAGCLKPDLVATVPFPLLWRPDQPFSGTSAAAPQAAALAALVWSRHPAWNANQVRAALLQIAKKSGSAHSTETGHGIVRLP
jgi:subtilisin family serine protease